MSSELLVENREAAYAALFAGEFSGEVPLPESEIGLAGLWREYTFQAGNDGSDAARLANIPGYVHTVLAYHDQAACGSDDSDSVFAILDPNVLTIAGDIASGILQKWERALRRGAYEPLLVDRFAEDFDSPAVEGKRHAVHDLPGESVVIELAAAILRVLPMYVARPQEIGAPTRRRIATILANLDPEFVAGWLDGSIINMWMEQYVPAPERASLQTILTPNIRRSMLTNHPLATLKMVSARARQLSDAAEMARQLEWDEAEIKQLLTPTVRRYLAVTQREDLLQLMGKIKTNLTTHLTTEAIAEYLDWTEAEANEMVTAADRRSLAVYFAEDPLAGIQRHLSMRARANQKRSQRLLTKFQIE